MSRMTSRAPLVILACFGVVAFATLGSCDADLETGCLDDVCSGTTTAGSGGSDGTGGGGFVCEHTDTAGFPCEVYDTLNKNCQGCHKPDGQGPFPLLKYSDTQQWLYGIEPSESPQAKRVWARMQTQIQPDAKVPRMPLNAHPMPQIFIDRLNAWFATCGTDIQAADVCARGTGTGGGGEGGAGGSGMGGAGGAGIGGMGGAGG